MDLSKGFRGDDRGSLVYLESNQLIPFQVQRVYFIYGTRAGVRRGFHAHKTLQQVLVCVSGSCRVKLDTGKSLEFVDLNSPTKGLFIGGMVWREMFDFSKDCVLLVLADTPYTEKDYIRNYTEFLKSVADSEAQSS
jgi:dTDP-4-dehydrorhamnose 3,5-epimerase-like enzyme